MSDANFSRSTWALLRLFDVLVSIARNGNGVIVDQTTTPQEPPHTQVQDVRREHITT